VALTELIERLPAAVPMAAPLLSRLAQDHLPATQSAEVLQRLVQASREHPGLDVMEAVVTLRRHLGDSEPPSRSYEEHLSREPSLVAATRWLASERLVDAQHHPQVNRALDHACQPLLRYRCAACGFEARQHFWQCPGCQTWDSFPTRRIEEL
jgi:lipopolysaccharide biosynthesis regulator YciM